MKSKHSSNKEYSNEHKVTSSKKYQKPKKSKTLKRIALLIFTLLFITTIIVHQVKPLPEGVSMKGNIYNINENQLTFLQDLTYTRNNQTITEHVIFDEVISMIQESHEFIIIDMFLFNEDFTQEELQDPTLVKRNITSELTQALVEQKKLYPEMTIIFITDGINDFYGSFTPWHYELLKEHNITIIQTDMTQLRDSNFLYSALYRVAFQWFGIGQNGIIPHPLGNDKHTITLRSGLKLLNFKANHRKLIVTDTNEGVSALITSANPHTPSNLHSNVGIRIDNSPVIVDILRSELGVVSFSTDNQKSITQLEEVLNTTKQFFENNSHLLLTSNDSTIQFLGESQIKNSIVQDLQNTQRGDRVELSMFYLSSRTIINELLEADKRGVDVYIILDLNVDAFGHEKSGIPNRVVAYELLQDSNISLRWYNTHGEQFHSKQLTIYKLESNTTIVHIGSTNYTRRNLYDFNLEANVRITVPTNSEFSIQISEVFSRIWNNEFGITHTLDAEEYKDGSRLRFMWYRIQEFTGLGTY